MNFSDAHCIGLTALIVTLKSRGREVLVSALLAKPPFAYKNLLPPKLVNIALVQLRDYLHIKI